MQNIRLENLLLIDIETVSESAEFDSLNKEWQALWQEKVQRTLPEDVSAAEFYPQRAGVMAEFAKVVCISIGYFKKEGNTQQLRLKSFYGDDEKILLQDFIAALHKMDGNSNKWSFTGHNIKEFDIPFICRRLLINGLPIPPFLDGRCFFRAFPARVANARTSNLSQKQDRHCSPHRAVDSTI